MKRIYVAAISLGVFTVFASAAHAGPQSTSTFALTDLAAPLKIDSSLASETDEMLARGCGYRRSYGYRHGGYGGGYHSYAPRYHYRHHYTPRHYYYPSHYHHYPSYGGQSFGLYIGF